MNLGLRGREKAPITIEKSALKVNHMTNQLIDDRRVTRLCLIPACLQCGFTLMSQKNPENEPMRDQQ
jgi:hypothetical protein